MAPSTGSFSLKRLLVPSIVLLSYLGAVAAQAFDPNSVSATTRALWCRSQISTCPLICQSAGSESVVGDFNQCNTVTLDFTCQCVNGFTPNAGGYTNTIPYFKCQTVFNNCIAGTPNDADSQARCMKQAATFCGTTGSNKVSTYELTTTSGGAVQTSTFSLTLVLPGGSETSSTPSPSASKNSSSTPTTTPPRDTTGTQSATNTNSQPPSSGDKGISTGALAAAIAVPIVVVLLLAIGSGIFFYRKRGAAKAAPTEKSEGWGKAELHGEHIAPVELPMQERYELDGEDMPREVVGDGPAVHEIGANRRDSL